MKGAGVDVLNDVYKNEYILKCDPFYFTQIWNGVKNFEVRKNDRNFIPGRYIILREYIKSAEEYSGRAIRCLAGFILYGSDKKFRKYKTGLRHDHCIIALLEIEKFERTGLIGGIL